MLTRAQAASAERARRPATATFHATFRFIPASYHCAERCTIGLNSGTEERGTALAFPFAMKNVKEGLQQMAHLALRVYLRVHCGHRVRGKARLARPSVLIA